MPKANSLSSRNSWIGIGKIKHSTPKVTCIYNILASEGFVSEGEGGGAERKQIKTIKRNRLKDRIA